MASTQEKQQLKFLLRFLKNQKFVSEESTFEHEELLPNLPLPTLSHTLQIYLDSVKAVASEEEFFTTLKNVNSFMKHEGKHLHDSLLRKERYTKNWVEDWWLDQAYLANRLPLVPYNTMASYPYIMSSFWPLGDMLFLEYGPQIIASLGEFYDLLRNEKLAPQKTSSGNQLSMHQARFIFNSCRVPGKASDKLINCFKTAREGSPSSHVIILVGGHILKVDLYNSHGSVRCKNEWKIILEEVWNMYQEKGKCKGVAALTCDSRDKWFENYEYLKNYSVDNATALSAIETSAFTISIYDDSPTQNFVKKLICTDPKNRWSDLSLCLALYRNGFGGMVADHTPFDGIILLQLGLYVASRTLTSAFNLSESKIDVEKPQLEELVFHCDDFITTKINEAVENNSRLMDDLTCDYFTYKSFGKSTLKKFKIHPDAFLQIAIQLAYFRIHHRLASVYESASTRKYYHGRTETIRSCTKELSAFVMAVDDGSINAIEKKKLLKDAVVRHVALVSECENNSGCDRHLFGLYMVALEEGIDIPELFKDPMFTRTGGFGNFNISSSLNGYSGFGGGIAPMPHDDCYGCFYSITDESIIMFLSSWKHVKTHDIQLYFQEIVRALDEMNSLYSLQSQL